VSLSKVLSIVVLLALSVGCQTKKIKTEQDKIQIINLSEDYKVFWNKAKGQDFKEQLKLWDLHVESAYPKFYSQVIHDKKNSKKWIKRKEESAKKLFKKLPQIHPLIVKEFNQFSVTVEQQFTKFKKLFPDADLSPFKIIAAPSLLRFNGQSNKIDDETILAFGMDFLALLKKEPNSIPAMNYAHNADSFYGHELFHLYGESRVGIKTEEIDRNEAKLVISLWNEGLATYVSSILNPKASLAEQFMDHKLAESCPAKLEELKVKFRKDMRKPLYDTEDRAPYIRWFLLSSKDKSIPVRAGYCVGYFVVKDLAKTYTVSEMANWNFKTAQEVLFKYFDGL